MSRPLALLTVFWLATAVASPLSAQVDARANSTPALKSYFIMSRRACLCCALMCAGRSPSSWYTGSGPVPGRGTE